MSQVQCEVVKEDIDIGYLSVIKARRPALKNEERRLGEAVVLQQSLSLE